MRFLSGEQTIRRPHNVDETGGPNKTIVKGAVGRGWRLLRGYDTGTEGDPYLDRLRIIQTPFFGIYLHRIHRADSEDWGHDHPWPFFGIILDGEYTEEIWPDKFDSGPSYIRDRKRFSLGWLPVKSAHRITEVRGVLWSLVFVGPRVNDWGFYPDGRYTPWRKFLGLDEMAEVQCMSDAPHKPHEWQCGKCPGVWNKSGPLTNCCCWNQTAPCPNSEPHWQHDWIIPHEAEDAGIPGLVRHCWGREAGGKHLAEYK